MTGNLYKAYNNAGAFKLCKTHPDFFSTIPLLQVAASYDYMMFLDRQGTCYAWGSSKTGALGIGQMSCTHPKRVSINAPVERIFLSRQVSFFVTRNNLIYTAGEREHFSMRLVEARNLKVKKPHRMKH